MELKAQETVYEVNQETMADVVSMMTGIPVNKIAQSESDKLLKMEVALTKMIVGQEEAILKLSKAIRRTRAGSRIPGGRSDRLSSSARPVSARLKWRKHSPAICSIRRKP